MVTERVRTLPTELMEGEIAKSNLLVSFTNICQRGRICFIHIIQLPMVIMKMLVKFHDGEEDLQRPHC